MMTPEFAIWDYFSGAGCLCHQGTRLALPAEQDGWLGCRSCHCSTSFPHRQGASASPYICSHEVPQPATGWALPCCGTFWNQTEETDRTFRNCLEPSRRGWNWLEPAWGSHALSSPTPLQPVLLAACHMHPMQLPIVLMLFLIKKKNQYWASSVVIVVGPEIYIWK